MCYLKNDVSYIKHLICYFIISHLRPTNDCYKKYENKKQTNHKQQTTTTKQHWANWNPYHLSL